MMMVRYLLDRDLPAPIPGIDEVRNDFTTPIEPLQMALAQERAVTEQVEALFRAARAENDVLGEQFMLWFLKEQVEEVASMSTLVAIAERAGDDWFRIEEHLTREAVGDAGPGRLRARDRRRPLSSAGEPRPRQTRPGTPVRRPPRRPRCP